VRESADESVLVIASRTDVDVELAPGLVPSAGEAEALFGDATFATAADGAVAITADGPVFAAWSLPGVRVPDASASTLSGAVAGPATDDGAHNVAAEAVVAPEAQPAPEGE
jgi:alpha-glucosidase